MEGQTFFMYDQRPCQFQPADASEGSRRVDQASYWALSPRVYAAPLIEDPPPSVLPLLRISEPVLNALGCLLTQQ